MTAGLSLFFVSAVVVVAICYVLARMRVDDIRDRRMKHLLPVCLVSLFGIIFNAAAMVVERPYFVSVYTAKIILMSIVPYLNTWFFLNFVESKLAESGPRRYPRQHFNGRI